MHAIEGFLITFAIALAVLGALGVVFSMAHRPPLRWITIYEWEHGVRFDRGKLRGRVEPGQYMYWPFFTTIRQIDARQLYVTVPGQEVLTSDAISIRVSLALVYEVVDAVQAITAVADYSEAIYLESQIALRELVAGLTIDELLAQRGQLGARIAERAQPKVVAFGLRLHSVELKDLMFPGSLRDTFAKVVEAQRDGLAALERARGESAALRHLANAARMIEDNPALLQLRLLQSIGESSGNTLVLGAPSDAIMKGARPESAGRKKRSDK